MTRPMTSNVSALSGGVANSHQAIHFVSSAPSKIPYGGFSPVRLQTGCQKRPSPSRDDFDASTVAFSAVPVYFRSRTCVRRHSQLLTPHACPVALGSAAVLLSAGLIAYYGHIRASASHLWFILWLCQRFHDRQKFPNLLRQGLIPCRRPYSGGSQTPMTSRTLDLAFTLSEEVRQPQCSTHRTTCGPIYEAAALTLCCGPESCLPRFRTGRLRPSFRVVDHSSTRRL